MTELTHLMTKDMSVSLMPMTENQIQLIIPQQPSAGRLDQVLAGLLPDYSRSRLQHWIASGQVLVNGTAPRTRDKVMGGERVSLLVPNEQATDCQPEAIPLHLLHEDEDLLIINKPAGLVVHPAAGNADGTLQNALLHHDPGLGALPRAGIVHRLDKDTSGLLVVARSPLAHRSLVEQLESRQIEREYRAICQGLMLSGGSVDAPIGRHPSQRTRMAVVPNGKPARTHYRVLERFCAHSLLAVKLESGRTHQIRVHLTHIRYPLLGDPVYGGRPRLPKAASASLIALLQGFKRQALHAWRLALTHPRSGDWLEWHSPLPEDMQQLLHGLREDAKNVGCL